MENMSKLLSKHDNCAITFKELEEPMDVSSDSLVRDHVLKDDANEKDDSKQGRTSFNSYPDQAKVKKEAVSDDINPDFKLIVDNSEVCKHEGVNGVGFTETKFSSNTQVPLNHPTSDDKPCRMASERRIAVSLLSIKVEPNDDCDFDEHQVVPTGMLYPIQQYAVSKAENSSTPANSSWNHCMPRVHLKNSPTECPEFILPDKIDETESSDNEKEKVSESVMCNIEEHRSKRRALYTPRVADTKKNKGNGTLNTRLNDGEEELARSGNESSSDAHCDKNASRKTHLKEHRQIWKKSYSCTYCSKTFVDSSDCTKHEQIHTGEKPYLCTHCNERFAEKSNCTAHEKTHTVENPYSCAHCHQKFSKESLLLDHEKIHAVEKPYPCNYCDKRFLQKRDRTKHERTHTGERPYLCAYCSMKFMQKSDCTKHERIHTGEKPFSCAQCNRKFSRKSRLVDHERVHTGEKPYSCSYCSKKFSQKGVCTEHEKIHRGERPYSCTDCNRSFTRKSYYVAHSCTGET